MKNKDKSLPILFLARLKSLKVIFTDFDGVWTDGKVFSGPNGEEFVCCSRRDTLRIGEILNLKIRVIVISKEMNPVVRLRCNKMKVECYQGVDDKLSQVREIMQKNGWKREEVAYVGDDKNDVGCLLNVGIPMAVSDADPECRNTALYVTERRGGDHAMREIFDLILENRQ